MNISATKPRASSRPLRLRAAALGLALLGPATLGLALLGQASGAQAAEFQSTQAIHRVEYWQRREAEISAAVRESPGLAAVKLVFLGDSITDFWLLDDNPWIAGEKFGRPLWNESFGGTSPENLAVNLGISGDRTEHVLFRIKPSAQGGLGQLDAPSLQPEFVVLLIGVNNTWAAETPVVESVLEGVRAVLRAVHERKPRARVILQSLLPTHEAARNREVVSPVNRLLAPLAASAEFAPYTRFLDLYPVFSLPNGAQNAALFVSDGVHPNREGYRAWRDRLLPFLKAQRATPAVPAASG